MPKPGLKNPIDYLQNLVYSGHFERTDNKILLLLILADFGFILAYILLGLGYLKSPNWDIAMDRGYSEIYQYIKEIWIVILFIIYGVRTLTLIYFSWSLLYLYIFLDDCYEFHEIFGERIAETLGFHPSIGLRAVDFGEMSIYILVGAAFILILVFSYYKSCKEGKKISNNLFLLLALLTFFGFFIDMIHVIIESTLVNTTISLLYFNILEDGGEMVAISLTVWFLLRINPTPYRFRFQSSG